MALTSAQYVVLRKPSLSGDSRLTDMIDLAETKLSEDVYGTQYAYAVALLTLHLYEMGTRDGAAGDITSETEGALSRSYGQSALSSSDNWWSATGWGQELINLTRSLIVFPRNRMM
jgi:hypothetical protein